MTASKHYLSEKFTTIECLHNIYGGYLFSRGAKSLQKGWVKQTAASVKPQIMECKHLHRQTSSFRSLPVKQHCSEYCLNYAWQVALLQCNNIYRVLIRHPGQEAKFSDSTFHLFFGLQTPEILPGVAKVSERLTEC